MFALKINRHQIVSYIKHFFIAKRKGHGVHSPFAYQLCEEVFYNNNVFYEFEYLNNIRNTLFKNHKKLVIEDFGAGSKLLKKSSRKIKSIATIGISTKHQSEILYRLVNFLNCTNAVELGTSLGINTLYLAKANSKSSIITIEGSLALFEFARQLSENYNFKNIQFIHDNFDSALPKVLNILNKLDFIYIDGNHTYEATIKYFNLALTKKHNNSVFIFDDIYWSKEMTQAWNKIVQNDSVTLSIDTFYFGMVFFKNEIKEKFHLKLYI